MSSICTLQIGDNDLIGNKFNGHNLQHELNARGCPTYHYVLNKQSYDNNTKEFFSWYENSETIYTLLRELESALNLHNQLNPYLYELLYANEFHQSDVLHFHLVHNNVLNFPLLPLLNNLKPIVWTLHDPWLLTGHCVHPEDCIRWQKGCGECPDLSRYFQIKEDVSALNWAIKLIYLKQCDIHFIATSTWIMKLAQASPILKNHNIHYVPLGIDTTLFRPLNKTEVRSKLGINQNDTVLCFRATEVSHKGFDFILHMLTELEGGSITIISFDQKNLLNRFKDKFNVVDFGWIDSDKQMVEIYNAADLFIMPSNNETFGMMAIEAMACGVPVLVQSGTALDTVVSPPDIGFSFQKGSGHSFLKLTQELIVNKKLLKERGIISRSYVCNNYDKDQYISKLLRVYQIANENHKPQIDMNHVANALTQCKETRKLIETNRLPIATTVPLKKRIFQVLFRWSPNTYKLLRYIYRAIH